MTTKTAAPEKKDKNIIKDLAAFDAVLDDTVELQMDKEALELERDAQILAVRKQFDGDIKEMADTIAANVAVAEEFARAHRAELLGETNKSETDFASYGFRIGNPALALVNSKSTWERVVELIKEKFGKRAPMFIRVKEEADKAAIKNHLDDVQRAEIGTVLERKETFYVDPKRDPADPHRLVSAK